MDPEFFSFTTVIVLLHLCSYFFFSAVGELSLLTADKEILLRRHLVDMRRGDMTEMILRYLLKWWLSSQDHSSFVNLVFLWQRMKGKWRSVIPFWHAKRHDISLHDKIPHTELRGKSKISCRTECVTFNLEMFIICIFSCFSTCMHA